MERIHDELLVGVCEQDPHGPQHIHRTAGGATYRTAGKGGQGLDGNRTHADERAQDCNTIPAKVVSCSLNKAQQLHHHRQRLRRRRAKGMGVVCGTRASWASSISCRSTIRCSFRCSVRCRTSAAPYAREATSAICTGKAGRRKKPTSTTFHAMHASSWATS